MARSDIKNITLKEIEENQLYGLYAGSIEDIIMSGNHVIYKIRDIYTGEQVVINIKVSNKETDMWLNNAGEVGWGTEKQLYNSFKNYIKVIWDSNYTKPIKEEIIAPKTYWRAREGEVELMQLITCSIGSNPKDQKFDFTQGLKSKWFDKVLEGDLEFLEEKSVNNYGIKHKVAGIAYVSEKQGIFMPFCPPNMIPFLIKNKGKLDMDKPDYHVKYFLKALKKGVPGYFEWEKLQIWEDTEIIVKRRKIIDI